MTESVLAVVCDAGPLIHLDELDCLPLLNDFARILVPQQVWQEVASHRPTVFVHPDLSLQGIEVAVSEQIALLTLVQALSLDLGEQAALSPMVEFPQAIFLPTMQPHGWRH